MIATPDYVGVDVSKHYLDLAITGRRVKRFGNTQAGLNGLVARLGELARPHLVCEATGSHTRLLRRELARHGIAMSRVNPRRVRELARAEGRLAKTDAIDAGTILRFAQLMQVKPDPTPDPAALALADLVRRRRQMVDMLAMEKQRLEHPETEPVSASIATHIDFLATQIAALDQAIVAAIAADHSMARRAELLCSIPGIGRTTAAVLIAEMPELGTIGNKQIAALAGVAPFNRDSGLLRGQAHIAGGRLSARCALYMASITAIRANPPISAFYKRLRNQGKQPKIAIVAAMRKLIITANVVLAKNTPWHDATP
jgi:transposase